MVNINKKRLFSKVGGEGSGLAAKVDPRNVSDVTATKEITTAEAVWLEADEEGRERIRLLKPVFAERMEQRHPETARKKDLNNLSFKNSLDIPTLHDTVHDPTHKEGDISQQSTSSEPEKGNEEIPATSGNGGDGNNNGNGEPPLDSDPEEPNPNPQPQKKESKMDKQETVYNKTMIVFTIAVAAICILIGGVGATVLSKNASEKEAAARTVATPAKTGNSSSDTVLTAGKSFQTGHLIGEEGVVYMDSEGNTYERHTAGWRECKFYANGVFIKRYFVGDTSKPHNVDETYNQCKLLGRVLMSEMKATIPYKMETAVTK